jgi:glyoxylase-like metal-dependent hydrolase (beta-lactamase superfamily II)
MQKTVGTRLAGIALLFTGTFAAYTQQQAKQAPAAFNLIKVADDLYDIDGGGAGNVGLYVTDEGAIVIDDKFDQHYDEILANVKKVTEKPVRYVINTHHHGDHSGGNAKMLAAGVEILMHKNARANLVNAKQTGAARVAFADEAQVVLGGKEVLARHVGRGHTNGDAVIFFPARRTIHTGDLMAGTTPLIDYANGGSLMEWTKTLDAVLKYDFDTVIPGHGAVTTKAGLRTFRDNVEKLQTALRQQVRSGKSKDEVLQFLTSNYGWGALQGRMSLDGVMTEMK